MIPGLLLSLAVLLATPIDGAAPLVNADTVRYSVLNHGRPAGEMTVVRAGDSTAVHYRFIDRNRGTHARTSYRFAADGTPLVAHAWTLPLHEWTPPAPFARLRVEGGDVAWNEQRTPREAGTWYWQVGPTPFDQALLARFLLRQPQHAARMRTGGDVRLEVVTERTVQTSRGAERVRMLAIYTGSGVTPSVLWVDAQDQLFANQAGWFITVRAGAEETLALLREPELAYRMSLAEGIAGRMPAPTSHITAIVDGDVFDAETGTLHPRTSVLIIGDRIAGVGTRASLNIPADAHVIDATGRTVIPGMWEMHGHQGTGGATGSSVEQLARGITTVRDLAADTDIAVHHRAAADAGRILSPRLVLAGFLEGPGEWAGPSDAIVHNEAEARAWVARYDSLGYRQLKLYNLVHPDFMQVIVQEARARGMRVSGHVPRGISLPTFVRMGADEVNHAAFFFSTFFPDSLWLPQMRAYSAVAAQVAGTVDVDGEEMTSLIRVLREHGTVVDGTFSIWIRELGQGGVNVTGLPAAVADSLAQASNDSYYRLIRRLYDAGVTMVPGTDAAGGRTFVAELETYERAGVPPAAVLQMATLTSARVMGDDRDYGSITAGKVADIAIIDGRPTERIGDLRRVEYVVRAGRVYRSTDLFEAIAQAPPRVQ
jgi:imidazolonepropionase-like amidohydrolase